MTEDEIIRFVAGLPGVRVETASQESGAPEVAWGDSFVYHDPGQGPDGKPGTPARMPFVTIVIKDYPGDTVSGVDRPGVFRLNIAVGRERFTELLGYPPAGYAERADSVDHRSVDRIHPHPVYAAQGWICVMNPGEATAEPVRSLLTEAHARAAGRHRAR
ncbi:erythromycin esterase [Amycolatopsis antarctica]|uniref:Erythromycin esterase n=1 Tax=Amycolatopsis antarctica TaxID=1854586 RepID=A0A263D2Z2_9PSEU|nr:DUF6194 family protein [Amycolatopsis antarctica]OZM71997.1 erythromycin esterase [Amycolatopsis antarctica]